jgi:hypothetical protein
MSDKMVCPKCEGCGAIALDPSLQKTLDYVRSRPKHLFTSVHVARKFRIKRTAACNRLRLLKELGHLSRKRVGPFGRERVTWGYHAAMPGGKLAGLAP